MMNAEQVVASLQEIQRQVLELQQGAVAHAQQMANNTNTLAMMQGAVAAMQAGQADGPRDRERVHEDEPSRSQGFATRPVGR